MLPLTWNVKAELVLLLLIGFLLKKVQTAKIPCKSIYIVRRLRNFGFVMTVDATLMTDGCCIFLAFLRHHIPPVLNDIKEITTTTWYWYRISHRKITRKSYLPQIYLLLLPESTSTALLPYLTLSSSTFFQGVFRAFTKAKAFIKIYNRFTARKPEWLSLHCRFVMKKPKCLPYLRYKHSIRLL